MLGSRFSRSRYSERGQSMIETALLLPILLLIAFNAINFGYFFFVVLNLSSAPRSGVQYSILGFATPGQFSLPPAGPATTPPAPVVEPRGAAVSAPGPSTGAGCLVPGSGPEGAAGPFPPP